MKKILTFVFVVILFNNCLQTQSLDETKKVNTLVEVSSLEESIMSFALMENISNEDLIKSHLLLSNLVLTEAQIDDLKKILPLRKTDNIKYLVTNYLLWVQTQEIRFKKEFIKSYPSSDELSLLNKAIVNSDYKTASSPFQNTLASFAGDSKEALTKLLKSVQHTDGMNADELGYQLREIHKLNKDRFMNVSNELGININDILNQK